MSNITLPRAVVEEVRSAIRGFYNKYSDEAVHEDAGRALAALAAALAEPEQKPEPATEAKLSAALTANNIPPGWWFIFNKGFRAAERFHGIGGSKT